MRKLLDRSAAVIGLALFAPAAFALQLEEAQMFVGEAGAYVLVLGTIVTIVFVYFGHLPDKHAATLQTILSDEVGAIHSVEADALVVECVRKMTDNKIGALTVMDAGKLIGIFTERDALSRVLAAGRDPRDTRVVEVMTTNPYCVSPEMTVDDAMELVSKKRFRHLPIVEDGKVEALLSNRDITHWLVKNRAGDVQNLVEVANRS
jgi:CBS domain-containing protein